MEMFTCFPPGLREELCALDQGAICDIRMFAGGRCAVLLTDGAYLSETPCSAKDVYDTAQALCGRMLRLMPECTGEGYLTLRGGHRMGLCGRVTREGGVLSLREVGSICLRIARAVDKAGLEAAQLILRGGGARGVLIAGLPGSGKTTLLRDAVRRISDGGLPVGLADERGEMAACLAGVPQLDVGARTHVLDNCKKAEALRWLLRALSPRLLAMDELYGREDCRAVREAAACGVGVLASVHAGDARGLCAREGIASLLREDVFSHVLFLSERRVCALMSAREALTAAADAKP